MATRRSTRPIRETAVPRRAPSLVPAHLGEAVSVALLALTVAGLALVIAGVGMLVMGLTLGARYTAEPPPNLAALALPPTLGGLGLVVLGIALAIGSVMTVAEVRGARLATGAMAAAAALLSAAGVVGTMATLPADPVLAVALTLAVLVFGVSAIVLLRPRR